MTYLAIILICLAGMPPKDCQVGNSVDVMFPPDEQIGLGACMTYGQQYAAESHLVIPGKTWPKIFCPPTVKHRKRFNRITDGPAPCTNKAPSLTHRPPGGDRYAPCIPQRIR